LTKDSRGTLSIPDETIGAQSFLYNWIVSPVPRVTREVEMAKDPVCNMDVDEKKAPATADYKGKTYYFCAPGCKKAFLQSPEKYLRPSK
jgi:YHS domain-containing protein